MNFNSLDAWYNQIVPTLTNRQNEVLNAIKSLGSASINEVAKYLGVYPNVISGRFTELKKLNKIVFVERKNKSDYYCINIK